MWWRSKSSEELFRHNLTRFYGISPAYASGKERECGRGSARAFVVQDDDVLYADRSTTKGLRTVNARMFDARERYRQWTWRRISGACLAVRCRGQPSHPHVAGQKSGGISFAGHRLRLGSPMAVRRYGGRAWLENDGAAFGSARCGNTLRAVVRNRPIGTRFGPRPRAAPYNPDRGPLVRGSGAKRAPVGTQQ